MLSVFGWWGINTKSGQKRFDEMAGMIPAFSAYVGWTLGGIAILWILVSALRGRAE